MPGRESVRNTGSANPEAVQPIRGGGSTKISARNQLKGKDKSVKHGPVSTEVVISVAKAVEITSVISESAAEELGLKKGIEVSAVIKASNVIIATD